MRVTGPRPDEGVRSMLLGESGPQGPAESWRRQFPEIVGRSPAMLKVLETVSKVARSDGAVLITGESGTGKELIASAIHRLSLRSDRPYVPINTSAVPDTLLESEFFGHEKGAFTNAHQRRAGKFELAHTGTLFLDEIGDMPLALQAKLLRVLQEKKFTPLGGNDYHDANVRIIAATNRNLEEAVRANTFRRDLFYRLNVLPIVLPALRERPTDIPDLLEHYVEVSNRMHGVVEPCWLDDEVVALLAAFHWPGNVRQLQNVVERLVVMKGGGAITRADLPVELIESIDAGSTEALPPVEARSPMPTLTLPRAQQSPGVRIPVDFGERGLATLPSEGLDLVRFVEALENDLIRQALERTGNNRNQAAKLLGLNRTTLVERIKKRKLGPLNEPSKEL
jgi:transcriptional regulator with GAF, ATPase, and Fis domain